jgi:HlyD family secretion protein
MIRWLAAGLLVLVAVIILYQLNRRRNGAEVNYKTQAVQRGRLTVMVTATGNLAPTNQVEVGSELSGIIKTVEADFNDRVKIGQALAKLDTSKLEAQVLQARATLAGARANVLQAKATVAETASELKRLHEVRRLSTGKAVSQSDLDAAQAALDRARADATTAEATVSQAKAALEVIETDHGKAVIRSPINGIVLSRSVDPGQTVAASLQAPVLFVLAEDLARMELIVDVDEADVGQVQEDQGAVFFVDAYPDRTYPARLIQVRYGPKTVDGVVTYETVLIVDNADLSLRPGMTATANITVKKIENAVLLPNAALRFAPPVRETHANVRGSSILSRLIPRRHRSQNKQLRETNSDKKQRRVWTLRDNRPTPITVTTGSTDGLMTEIISGEVEPGMALVIDAESVNR